MQEAQLLGVHERHAWRLLAAYRKERAATLAHENRGRLPPNTTPVETRQQVLASVHELYDRITQTHLAEW